MGDLAFEWIVKIFSPQVTNDVVDALNFNFFTDKQVWSVVESTYLNIALPIGTQLILVYFLVSFLRDFERIKGGGIEAFFGHFVRLGIALIIIGKAPEMFQAIFGVSRWMVSKIGNPAASGVNMDQVASLMSQYSNTTITWDAGAEVFVMSEKIKFMNALGIIMKSFIPYLAVSLGSIIIQVVAFARSMELAIRFAFLPIGISDIAENKMSGNAGRYIKTYAALALQGAIIVGVSVLFNSFTASIFSSNKNVSGFLIAYIASIIAYVTLIGQSRSISRDLFNV